MVFTLEFPEPRRKAPGVGAALGGAGWGRSARPTRTLKALRHSEAPTGRDRCHPRDQRSLLACRARGAGCGEYTRARSG